MKKPKVLKVVKPKPSLGYVCINCGKSFPSLSALIKHTDEVHNKKKEKEEKVVENSDHLPPVEKETIKNPISSPEPKKFSQGKIPTISPKIELGYKYTGNCPVCNNEVETLMIDVEVSKKVSKQFAIAFCNNCKKKLKSREVVKL